MKVITKLVDAEEVLEWLFKWRRRNYGIDGGSCQKAIDSLIEEFADRLDLAQPAPGEA